MTDDLSAAHWAARAEEARLLAEQFHEPECRRIMREIALGYARMANFALQQREIEIGPEEGAGTQDASGGKPSPA